MLNVGKNLSQFCMASNFQKMVISIMSSLKVQKEELMLLKKAFHKIDINQDGSLTKDELQNGLHNLPLFEIM